MEHKAAATFLILLIDSRQGRGVEMAPLEGPEGWSRSNTVESTSALKINCVFLTGSLVHTGGCADTGVSHTGAFSLTVIPGRKLYAFLQSMNTQSPADSS